VAVFFALTPYALLDFTTFVGDLAAQTSMARNAGMWPFTLQYVDTQPFVYQVQQLTVWGLGIPLGVAAWAAVPFSAVMAWRFPQTRRADLLLLSWIVPQFIFLQTFEVHFLRYVFPLAPFMILLAARMLVWLVEVCRDHQPGLPSAVPVWRRLEGRLTPHLPRLGLALTALVLAFTAFYALAFMRIYTVDHPAVAASRWMQQNLPPGTRVISDNHWDEFIPGLYAFDMWQFPAYEADRPEKMNTLASHLADSEYLVFYSYRPFVSVARAPERYPLSAGYYQRLFTGDLGYRLERTFTAYPEFLGVSFRDSPYGRAGLPRPQPMVPEEQSPVTLNLGYADDNVVGYDHPQVLLFRNVERRDEADLLMRLMSSAPSTPAPGQVGLMMSEETRVRQQAGGTWSEIFRRDSWSNRYPVLAWLLAIEVIYLAALPLALFIFRPLPDRGIVLGRILGLLLVGYIAWLAVSLDWLDFSIWAIVLGMLVVTALSAVVLAFRWREIQEFLTRHWKLLLLGEGLFLLAFLAFVGIRALNPDLWHPFRGGEKPMEFAYLNAVVRSTTFPPYDPWFAGGYLNYYHWGYYVVALLVRLTGVIPAVAFNLAVPLFFALTFTGAYSVVYNLAQGVRRSRNGDDGVAGNGNSAGRLVRSPVSAGLMAGVLATVMGNLDGAVQLVQGFWGKLTGPAASLPPFDFWRSSRLIPPLENFDPSPLAFWAPEKVPGAPGVSFHITEFPFFTFLFADLHPHMMVLPFTLLVIGLGLALVAGLKDGGKTWLISAALALGLALGSLWVINSWDYPSYLLLTAALLAVAVLLKPGALLGKLALLVPLALGVVLVSVLAFWPFHQAYETFDAGVAASRWRTPLDRYIGIHGVFLLVAGTFLAVRTGPALARLLGGMSRRRGASGDDTTGRSPWPGVYLTLGLLGVIYLAAAGFWTGALLLAMLVLTGLAFGQAWASGAHRPYTLTPLALLGLALGIGIGVDLVRLEDDIGRMNTLFKLYLEAWLLFSLAAAYMLWRLVDDGWLQQGRAWAKTAWVAALMLLLAAGMIYPILGTPARLADRFQSGPLSLRGDAYMREAVHWEEGQPLELRWDLEAIEWLQDNVAGSPVVLEAHNHQYRWSARIASYTGLPTVLGWPWHQTQQRFAYAQTIPQRAAHVTELYNTTDIGLAEDLLRRYEVRYIVVGELERVYYAASGLDKFGAMAGQGLLQRVYENPGVLIYEVK
jgi:YYY domain-containing protein